MAKAVLREARSLGQLQELLGAYSNNVRGAAFELLVRHYLDSPFSTFGFTDVWSTNERVPAAVLRQVRLPQGDTKGIDLIAKTHGGEYWAVQCKYHQDPAVNLQQGECEGMVAGMAYSGRFKAGIVCTSAFDLSRNIDYPLQYLTNDAFDLGPDFFDSLHVALVGAPRRPLVPFKPRDYQAEAIKAATETFATNDRAQFLMACATGKTHTAFFISEELKARVVVWAVPNLSLAKQHLTKVAREYAAHDLKVDYIAVCSDETVKSSSKEDENFNDPRMMNTYVGTNISAITSWLTEDHHDADRLLIFTTYQSSAVFAEAARKAELVPDLAIFDEAHRTVAHEDGTFAYLLYDENLRIRKRAFFTATPRVYRGPNDAIRDMSDPAVYGPVAYRLTTKEAIERAIIADYVVHVLAVSDGSTRRYVEDREDVFIEELRQEANAATLAGTIGLLYLMSKQQLTHALTFSSTLKRMDWFQNLVARVEPRLPCETFRGADSAHSRKDKLELFEQAKTAIASNVRVFVEGVDCPQIDCVALLDPKGSKVDIQQAVGRGLRPQGNKVTCIYVPVVLDDGGNVPEGAWAEPLEILRALREQDDTLVDVFNPTAPGPQGPIGRVVIDRMPGVNVKLEDFREQVRAQAWDKLTRGNVEWQISTLRPFYMAKRRCPSVLEKSEEEFVRIEARLRATYRERLDSLRQECGIELKDDTAARKADEFDAWSKANRRTPKKTESELWQAQQTMYKSDPDRLAAIRARDGILVPTEQTERTWQDLEAHFKEFGEYPLRSGATKALGLFVSNARRDDPQRLAALMTKYGVLTTAERTQARLRELRRYYLEHTGSPSQETGLGRFEANYRVRHPKEINRLRKECGWKSQLGSIAENAALLRPHYLATHRPPRKSVPAEAHLVSAEMMLLRADRAGLEALRRGCGVKTAPELAKEKWARLDRYYATHHAPVALGDDEELHFFEANMRRLQSARVLRMRTKYDVKARQKKGVARSDTHYSVKTAQELKAACKKQGVSSFSEYRFAYKKHGWPSSPQRRWPEARWAWLFDSSTRGPNKKQ